VDPNGRRPCGRSTREVTSRFGRHVVGGVERRVWSGGGGGRVAGLATAFSTHFKETAVKRSGERRRNRGGRQLRGPPLIALAHRSVAQITRMAPHARRACARIASIESESRTRVLSRVLNPDSLRFSEVFRSAPFRAIATESSKPRCSGDGSIPTAPPLISPGSPAA
jgi:hypothetical protein